MGGGIRAILAGRKFENWVGRVSGIGFRCLLVDTRGDQIDLPYERLHGQRKGTDNEALDLREAGPDLGLVQHRLPAAPPP
jgi:hypothetical protein